MYTLAQRASAWCRRAQENLSWLASLTDPRPVIITLATQQPAHRRRQPATSTCLGCIFQGWPPLCSQTSPRQHCSFGDVSFCTMQFPTPEKHTSQTRTRATCHGLHTIRPWEGNEKKVLDLVLAQSRRGACLTGSAHRRRLACGLAAFCGAVQWPTVLFLESLIEALLSSVWVWVSGRRAMVWPRSQGPQSSRPLTW